MAILKKCELYYVRCNPARPNAKQNKTNPTWELQMRTTDKAQKEEWASLGLKCTAVRDDEEGPIRYWRTNIRKRSIKSDGEKADAPKVETGRRTPLDADTIGNGSVGNVRVYQYDYNDEESGRSGTACVLMGLQITKLIKYERPENNNDDEFDEDEFEVVDEDGNESDEDEVPFTEPAKVASPSVKPKDQRPEEEF